MNNFEVTIPTSILRGVRDFHLNDIEISFVRNEIHARAKFLLSSPLAVPEIVYRHVNETPTKTFNAEYQLLHVVYEIELIAIPDTASVEFGTVDVSISDVKISPTQDLFGDEKDIITRKLLPYLKSYFTDIFYRSFSRYVQGIVAEGRY